jgi:ketosteroid isomerase-like protein
MGNPNEDLLRQGYDAFGRGDMEWLNEHFADDIVWHVPGQNPFAGNHRGKEAVFALFAKQMELTDGSLRLEIHDVLANDEHGVALATVTATREGKCSRTGRHTCSTCGEGRSRSSGATPGTSGRSTSSWPDLSAP